MKAQVPETKIEKENCGSTVLIVRGAHDEVVST
jgi:hypothetical protein